MLTLGQAAAAVAEVTEPLPLYATLLISPEDHPSIPESTLRQMYSVLQSLGRALVSYGTRNPEYVPNVNTWLVQANRVVQRARTGAWARDVVARNYDNLVNFARELLATPEAWTAYVGSALSERITGVSQAIRSAAVALPTAAERVAERVAAAAGRVTTSFVAAAMLPLLLVGGFWLFGVYLYAKTRK